FDVGAGGDHVHGDGDAGIDAIAKTLDEIGWVRAGGAVGDLLAEVVSFAELFAHDLDDVVGVGVVFREDKCLRNYGAAGKDFSEQPVAKGSYHGADLIGRDNGAVELVFGVDQIIA